MIIETVLTGVALTSTTCMVWIASKLADAKADIRARDRRIKDLNDLRELLDRQNRELRQKLDYLRDDYASQAKRLQGQEQVAYDLYSRLQQIAKLATTRTEQSS